MLDGHSFVGRALKNAARDFSGFKGLAFHIAERPLADAIPTGLDQGLIYAVATAT